MKLIGKFFHILKRIMTIIPSKVFIVAIIIIMQIGLMLAIPEIMEALFPLQYGAIANAFDVSMRALGGIAVVYIISKDENPYFKMSWIALFFFLPLVGLILYLIMAQHRTPKRIVEQTRYNVENIKKLIPDDMVTAPNQKSNLLQSKYVKQTSAYPVVANTKVDYYTLGDTMFPAFLEDLKKAERYIFLEFFIIEEGNLMDQLLEVLTQKIKEGVEVYFMYDDIGSIFTVDSDYINYLRRLGIEARVFNPLRPRINPVFNYRDHRKIIVVDGKIAYCGGMNLADEYINEKLRFGHWKDTGVRLEGDGAWSFTIMFMQQWRFITGSEMKLSTFRPKHVTIDNPQGVVQPYADDPLSKYNIAENVYLNAIWQAKEYIYITTPYLIIDNAMEGALCYAAISGVDVRIITPKIYDKWYVHLITRSNYKKLIENGVKIYEYTPGFVHSKMFVSDDRIAMVGTSNMDFRSFYHHYECSAIIYENPAIKDVKNDIAQCIKVSEKMTVEEMANQPIHIKMMQGILKLTAPLM